MNCGQKHAKASRQNRPGYTLLELLVVISIIAILATVAMPHLSGMTKSHGMTTATRQMLDDVALARQKAISTRSSVYMVFMSDTFMTDGNGNNRALYEASTNHDGTRIKDLANNELRAYALLSMRSVGDQPGQNHVRYLTDWKILPAGAFISTNKFRTKYSLVTITNLNSALLVSNFQFGAFPFPTANSAQFSLPYIKFNSLGQLANGTDEYITLTSGSVLVPDVTSEPIVTETPPGASTNNYNVIAIDWLTGRAKLLRKEIQ